MDFEFAAGVSETRFRGLNEALNYLDEHSLRDKLVSTSEVTLASTNGIRLGNRKPIPMTRAAFVQLLHFVRLSWSDVKEEDPVRVAKAVRRRLTARPGTLLFRIQRGAVQAVLSPAYTPITNADVLHSVRTSLNLSKTMVTFYRGQMRITGVSDRISFQPQVGDVISGGWEITNNQFGKGSIRINQFLPRLVCTNGAVIETGSERRRLVHRGWDHDELMKHVGDISSATITQMKGINEALRSMTQTRMGQRRHHQLVTAAAPILGRKGSKEFRTEVGPESSVYDAYNYLTFVSQQKQLGPRRALEVVAGSLVGGK